MVDGSRAAGRLVVADDVSEALAAGRAVVALESTIISHGMPHPDNVSTALACEAAVRDAGAVPATVAVIDGTLRVGLADDEVERLGRADDVAKVSLRDLGWVLSGGGLGATTVAATMHAADLAGIRVFATGGIGGVHRGDDHDVSADLTALGTIPVAVVCSGPKAVLDVARTVEALETLGVPVIGQGVDVLPEFWTRGTDLTVGTRSDDAARTAAILEAHWGCGLTTGAVVANPIPAGHELDRDMIATAIESGLAAAATRGIRGREVTPFLLTHVAAATDGRSQVANMALVRDNAAVAGRIAVALATLHGSTEARVGSAG